MPTLRRFDDSQSRFSVPRLPKSIVSARPVARATLMGLGEAESPDGVPAGSTQS